MYFYGRLFIASNSVVIIKTDFLNVVWYRSIMGPIGDILYHGRVCLIPLVKSVCCMPSKELEARSLRLLLLPRENLKSQSTDSRSEAPYCCSGACESGPPHVQAVLRMWVAL